jgi:hypothetical protein
MGIGVIPLCLRDGCMKNNGKEGKQVSGIDKFFLPDVNPTIAPAVH